MLRLYRGFLAQGFGVLYAWHPPSFPLIFGIVRYTKKKKNNISGSSLSYHDPLLEF